MKLDSWEIYKHEVALHGGYLDLVIKINTFYYAITGAVVSFYFLHIGDKPFVKWSLVLPIAMTIALSVFYWKSANAAQISQRNLDSISQELEFKVGSVVAGVLAYLLRIFFWLFVITAFGLTVLFFEEHLKLVF